MLRATHFAYDVTDARADPNVVFPLETLRATAREGGIGEVAPNAYTFMGGIYSARKVRDVLAPALAGRMEEDAVDAAVARPGLTRLPSVRGIDSTRDRGPRHSDHLHVERPVHHRGGQPASCLCIWTIRSDIRRESRTIRCSNDGFSGTPSTRWSRSTLREPSAGCRIAGPTTMRGRIRVMRPDPSSGSTGDDRIERHPDPQYQCEEDRIAAEAELERNGCPSCVFLGAEERRRIAGPA